MKTLILSILLLTMANISNAQIQTGSFSFDGHTRSYKVFLPNNYSGAKNFALMIYLHAYDWTPELGMEYTLMNNVADTAGFIVAYPYAINNRWNSGIGDNIDYPAPNVDDVGFIDALIDTLSYHFSIDLERIYACGFSNGGFMSYKLACQLSHRIAAIASVAGTLSTNTVEECNPQHTMPVLQIHGTNDELAPFNGTTGWYSISNTLDYWADFNACNQVDTLPMPDIETTDGCTVEKISYSNCSGDSKILFFKVNNGGHSWPSATSDFSWSGNRNLDINASVEIWNFFKQYENPLVNMAYSNSLEVYPSYILPLSDTITVRASISNPENHPVNVFAVIQGEQSLYTDSLQLFDDGLHSDGESNDNLWGNIKWTTGLLEDKFQVDLITYDSTFGTSQYFYLPSQFTTLGPVVFESYTFSGTDTVPDPGDQLRFVLTIKNNSLIATATNLKAELSSNDTLVLITAHNLSYADIPAGESAPSNSTYSIRIYEEHLINSEIPIAVNISSNDFIFWSDTFSVLVQEPVHVSQVPEESLLLVYPNPAKDNLSLKFSKTLGVNTSIVLFDITGKAIYSEILESDSPLTHTVNLSELTEGLYLLMISNNEYSYTEKVIKVK